VCVCVCMLTFADVLQRKEGAPWPPKAEDDELMPLG
jgi:hypothetical protein